MNRLAIVSSHPIQYNAPWFRLLAERKKVQVKVFYTWEQSVQGAKYDPGFGREIEWDIPLLEGYDHVFVKNVSKDPGTHHFKGIVNPNLNEEIERWKPDTLLVIGWSFKSHLQCLRYFHGKVKILFRGDSTLLNDRPGIRKIARTLFLKWVYRYVDIALYVGANNKLYYQQYGLKPHQLVYAPHAIDNRRFMEPEAEYAAAAGEWRQQLGIHRNELTILYAGKLEKVKNLGFIAALAASVREMPVKFVMVGNGHLENELKASMADKGNVIFLDFQNQSRMPVVYRLGDIFIMPSVSETWGLGANEAMASGCIVMLSERVGGAIDLVNEPANGIIFPLDGLEKCRQFIKRLIDAPQEAANMKEASKQLIKNFTFRHIAAAIESACDGTGRGENASYGHRIAQ